MAIQLTCPFCHEEFPYENEQTDQKLRDISMNIELTKAELQKFKLLSKEEKTNETWKERQYLIHRLNKLNKDYQELKAYRSQAEFARDRLEMKAFKSIVKDLIGEKQYQRIWDQVAEEMKAYEIKSLMRKEYSRNTNTANVTTINKI